MTTRRGGQPQREPARAVAPPPPFLLKTYELVEDPETDNIISWGPDGTSFVVWKNAEFARDLLPLHFKHSNFSSFVRQLNTYGFRKVDPDRWEFANEAFIRGQRHLLGEIHRRKPSAAELRPGGGLGGGREPGGSLSAVELGAYGGLAAEVETLQRDKRLLVAEVVRLRQAQAGTEATMASLQHRLGATEARQQQMVSFLAKAMHHPALLQQFMGGQQTIQRIDDGRRRKKRRGGRPRSAADDSESEGSGEDSGAARPTASGTSGSSAPAPARDLLDQRMILHQPGMGGVGGPGSAASDPSSASSLAELAQAFMQLLAAQSQPIDPPPAAPAAPPPQHGLHDLGASAGVAPGSQGGWGGMPAIPRAAPPMDVLFGGAELQPPPLVSATPASAMRDFVPLSPSPLGGGPTITEVGPEPLGDLPVLDAFSLEDLDFDQLAGIDRDLMGAGSETAQLSDPFWASGVPEVSSPSFNMPDFGDLNPIISEPADH